MPASSGDSNEIKREVRSTFDFISDDYDKLRGRIWEDLTKFITESLFSPTPSRNDIALDLACGNARHAIYFSEKNQFRSVGIDFSYRLLRHAKRRVMASKSGRLVALVNADASNIPLKDGSIKDVLYIAAIHHLPKTSERLKSLRETFRILGDEGRAVVTVWRKWQRRFALHFMVAHLRHSFGGKTKGQVGDIYIPWRSGHGVASVSRFYHLFSERELRKIISVAGFRVLRISKSSKKAGEGSFFASIEKK
jgi:tRNA (uracil-5-)-methyltransferase TRM9